MCELLVRVIDKVNAENAMKDAGCTKRGDVIAIVPDGWGWGRAEIGNPDWAIVRLPRVSESEAASFVAPELRDDPSLPNLFLQRRAFRLDVDALGLVGGQVATLDMDWQTLRNWRKTVAPLPDPMVL